MIYLCACVCIYNIYTYTYIDTHTHTVKYYFSFEMYFFILGICFKHLMVCKSTILRFILLNTYVQVRCCYGFLLDFGYLYWCYYVQVLNTIIFFQCFQCLVFRIVSHFVLICICSSISLSCTLCLYIFESFPFIKLLFLVYVTFVAVFDSIFHSPLFIVSSLLYELFSSVYNSGL